MRSLSPKSTQEGAVTLVITLLVLIAITIGSFAMVQTSTFEGRMTANDQRSREALQAAQSGIDYVLAHLAGDPVDTVSLCDMDTLDNFGFQLSFEGPFVTGGLDFDPVAHNASCLSIPFDIVTTLAVWSRGYSEDRESVRTLASTLDLSSPWNFLYSRLERDPIEEGATSNPPIRSLGSVSMDGTPITALCELEANSPYYCWNLDTGGKAQDGTYLIDGPLVQAAGGVQLGDASPMTDENVSEFDAVLQTWDADTLFTETFGVDMEEWLATGVETGTPISGPGGGNTPLPSGATGKVYIDGDFTLGGGQELGTQKAPVQLVVTGKLTLTGNAILYGTVYAGSVQFSNPAGKSQGAAGTVKVMGSIASVGDVNMSGNPAVYTPPENPDGGDPVMPTQAELDQILAEYAAQREVSVRVGSWREVRN